MRKVNLPDGSNGDWSISHVKVDHIDWSIVQSGRLHPELGETYTLLRRNRTIVMSDTPAEQSDHWYAERKATGNVLINGLGLGMFLQAVLDKPDVTKVTVVEVSKDLIDLVGPHYVDPRLTIVHADAFKYQPPKGERFNVVWHDIWDEISVDNLGEMATLHRKYGRRTDWQGSWCKGLCLDMRGGGW